MFCSIDRPARVLTALACFALACNLAEAQAPEAPVTRPEPAKTLAPPTPPVPAKVTPDPAVTGDKNPLVPGANPAPPAPTPAEPGKKPDAIVLPPDAVPPSDVAPPPPPGQPEVRYFLLILGYQDARNSIKASHSFGTFIRTTKPPEPGAPVLVENHSISWLPVDYPRTFRLGVRTKCGHNFTLTETMAFAKCQGLCVCHWGPYEIDEELYNQGLARIKFLESGCAQYRVRPPLGRIFPGHRAPPASPLNCKNAMTDITGFVKSGVIHGCDASQFVVCHFWSHFLNHEPQEWVYKLIFD